MLIDTENNALEGGAGKYATGLQNSMPLCIIAATQTAACFLQGTVLFTVKCPLNTSVAARIGLNQWPPIQDGVVVQ